MNKPLQKYSPTLTLVFPTPVLFIPTLIPRSPTLITRILTLIPRIHTLIPRIPIIALISFPESPFRFFQIASKLLYCESEIERKIVDKSCYITMVLILRSVEPNNYAFLSFKFVTNLNSFLPIW